MKKRKALIYNVSLTAAYTTCPYCGSENQEETIQDETPETPEVSKCTYCGQILIGIDRRESPALKAVNWYKTQINHPDKGWTDEEIKKAQAEYKKHKQQQKNGGKKT